MGLDIVVCNLLHKVVKIKMPCLAWVADCQWTTVSVCSLYKFKCSHAMSYVATAQHFCHLPFVTFVQHLSHLCDAVVTVQQTNETQVQSYFDSTAMIHRLSSAAIHSHVNSTEFTCSCTQSAQMMAAMCLAQTALSKL